MAVRGLNKVQVIGFLGNNPEVRQLNNGSSVVNLSIATSESWIDKATGEKREITEWHRICLFGKLAEIAGKYLHKSAQVYIEGKLRTRKWTDANGKDRYTTEIVGDQMQMLGKKGDRLNTEAQQPQAQPQQPQAPQPVSNAVDEIPEDEIPFK